VTDLLTDPNLDGLLAQEWENYFLRALLVQLSEAGREALTRLSIFRTRLGDEEFAYAGVEAATVGRWLDLSLLQREVGRIANPSYSVHPVVRDYLLDQMAPDARRELHTWAAAYYGQPFVEIAREFAAQSDEGWTDEQIEALARDYYGAVGQMVRCTDDLAQARAAMFHALEWQYHLFKAGAYEAAGEIVMAVVEVLARWGEFDRAKALLHGSIDTLEGGNKAVTQGNLTQLLVEEGKLEEGLVNSQEAYRIFEAMGAKRQMTTALNHQSIIYRMMGRYDDAITAGNRALELARQLKDKVSLALNTLQLSILYMQKSDYDTALAHSQEAEKMAHAVEDEALIAMTLHQQGLILNCLADVAQTDEERMTYLRAAFERLQQSLAIVWRIGDQAGAADTLGELGKLLMDAGQMRAAIAAFTNVLEIDQRLGRPGQVGVALVLLGSVHERQGQYAAALEKYQQALGLFQQYAPPEVERCKRIIARVQAKLRGE
jgi:tetratricopeptide (TPR) repeat protein